MLNPKIELVKIIFGNLGMENYRVRIGLRDSNSDKYVGESRQWDKAEEACRKACFNVNINICLFINIHCKTNLYRLA